MVAVNPCPHCGEGLLHNPETGTIWCRKDCWVGNAFHWGRWFGGDWIHVAVSCYPHHWGLHWRENGGRQANECLDMTLMIGPWSFGLTIWGLGQLSRLTRWLPIPNGRGYFVGW